MSKMIKRNIHTGTINVDVVKEIKFKKLTRGVDSLTFDEKKALSKWDWDGEKVVKAVVFELMSRSENVERQRKGLPPRVLKPNPRPNDPYCHNQSNGSRAV